MLKAILHTLLLYTAPTLSAHVPNLPQTDGSLLAASSASSGLPLPPTNSTLLSNGPLSTTNVLKIGCDSRRYGRDLKVKSCRDVFRYVKYENEQITFSERDSGISHDVGLPLRTYSTIDDGVCFLQPSLRDGAVVGHASPQEIARAAAQLLRTCVIERGMGGLAFLIGGDDKVQVELAKYEPNIKCDTSSKPGPPWLSCVTVFSNMRASKQYRVFGSYDRPNIEESLPLVLEAGDGRCQVEITITGHTSTLSSWYEIWAAVAAITSMCTRGKAKGGKARGLGAHQNIVLELSNKAASAAPAVGRLLNVTGGEARADWF